MTRSNAEKSYYIELKEFYENNQGELYSFQDLEMAGNYEYRVFTGKVKPLKEFRQNKIAAGLVKILLKVNNNQKEYKCIEKYLKLNKIIYYYESFRDTLNAVIENDNEKKTFFKQLAENIILTSRNEEIIKLALIICQIVEIENLEKILDVFSIHNDFIFYVINDYSHMEGKNNKIFEIVKNSKSYGKFFGIAYLKVVTNEMENWLVENGCIDNYGIPEITEYSILAVNILEYLNRVEFTSSSIDVFAKTFSVMLSDYGLYELDDKINVCKKILEIINEVGGKIYSLYAVVSILYSIDGIIIEYYKEKKNIDTLVNYTEYTRIIELCTHICNEPYWQDIIKEEINNIEIEPDVLITCIEKTGYKLKKKEYENILKRNYFSPLLYKYALCVGNKAIRKTAFRLGVKNLPIQEMATGAEDFKIENITYEDISYICFYILVKNSQLEDFNDDIDEYKSINLIGLECSLNEIREECINNLIVIKNIMTEQDRKVIYRCINREVIPSIRRKLKCLVENDINQFNREEIVSKKPETIQINPKDTFLLDTNILGEDEFNRAKIQALLNENAVTYIMNNPIEKSTFSTVVCTSNGYIIGYIEKPIDDILSNLIQSERYVYGVIKEISDDLSYIHMSLYLSYKDVEDGVSDILALLSKNKEKYIQ
ncbi:MAG: DNA-binding protein [Clostridium butyricum]|nr:DNA-binding protein [Clostridium butyricum]